MRKLLIAGTMCLLLAFLTLTALAFATPREHSVSRTGEFSAPLEALWPR